MGTITKTIPAGSPYTGANSDIGTYSNLSSTDITIERTIDFDTITMTNIRNVLSEGSQKLSVLSQSSNINDWALFHPDKSTPHGMGEFAGYNHNPLPPTHFFNKDTTQNPTIDDADLNKIRIDFLLNRGERPPSLDDARVSWDNVRLRVVSTDATVSFDKTMIASVLHTSLSTTPQHYVEVQMPSNDPYTFNVSVECDYADTVTDVIKPIEDTHPDVTIQAEPFYYGYDLTTTNMSSYYNTKHVYIYGSEPNYVLDPTNNEFQVDVQENPAMALATQAFIDSIPASVDDGGITKYYSYSIGVMASGGTEYTFTILGNQISVGYTFKKDGTWYEVNSIESGYLGYDVSQ